MEICNSSEFRLADVQYVLTGALGEALTLKAVVLSFDHMGAAETRCKLQYLQSCQES